MNPMLEKYKSHVGRVAPAIDRAIGFLSPERALARKRARIMDFKMTYEGARPGRSRDSAPQRFESQDANANAIGRARIMAEARDLEDNVGLVVGINRTFAKYVAGKVRPQSRTGDPTIDQTYEDYFRNWTKIADLTGRHSFTNLVQLAVISMKRDGDIGFVKVRNNGMPALQAIESDRIGNPLSAHRLENYVLGVFIDAVGRPTGYRVYNRGISGIGFTTFRDVGAGNFIHLFDPTRFDQYRGVSAYHAAVNNLRDIKEILEYEKMGVKWGASIAGVVTKAGGSIAADVPLTDEVNSDGNTDKIETVSAATVHYLSQGEDFKAFMSDRPSTAFQGFIPMLIRDIAVGMELPFGFVWDMSGLGGVPSRFESQQAARTFARTQDLLCEKMLNPVWSWVIADGIERRELPISSNFWKVFWQFSAHPTVDVGRESAANLNENRQGLKSAATIYGEQGMDWEEEQEQCAREAANIQRLAKKYGVDATEIRMMTPNGNSQASEMNKNPAKPGEKSPAKDEEDDANTASSLLKNGCSRF